MRIRHICAYGALWPLCVVLAVGLSTGFAQPAKPAPSTMAQPQGALRIGMTPNYPPVVFKDQDTITGLEADFASAVGQDLERRVVLIELPWKELIPGLEAGRIDVIMSGMSITETQDTLARLIEQLHARSQDIQHHLRHVLTDQPGDGEARVAMLEAAWSQLEKVAQIAVQELSTQPQSPESS